MRRFSCSLDDAAYCLDNAARVSEKALGAALKIKDGPRVREYVIRFDKRRYKGYREGTK